MKSVSNILYPRTGDRETIYLKAAVTDPSITVGDLKRTTFFTIIPSTMTGWSSANFVPLRAASNFFLPAPTTALRPFPPIPSPSFLRNGGWM